MSRLLLTGVALLGLNLLCAGAARAQPGVGGIAPSRPSGSLSSDGKANGTEVRQTRRILKVKNNSGTTITIWLQFCTENEAGKSVWYPASPENSTQAISFRLEPGQEGPLQHGDFVINASRVRLWAMRDGRRWERHRTQDFWLVPEQDQQGVHCYYATEMKSYTFEFAP